MIHLLALLLSASCSAAVSSGTAPGAVWRIETPALGLPAADAALASWAGSQRDEFLSISAEGPVERSAPYEFRLDGSSMAPSGRVVSVLLSAWSYTGGAHGNAQEEAFLFDAGTGRRLKTSDLFVPGAPWLQELSKLCAARLRSVLGPDGQGVWVAEGTKPTEENFRLVMVSGRELVVRFGAYQVAPYVNGPQTVRLPFDSVRKILRREYLKF